MPVAVEPVHPATLVTCHGGLPEPQGWPDPRCLVCGRESEVIVLNIVRTVLPNRRPGA